MYNVHDDLTAGILSYPFVVSVIDKPRSKKVSANEKLIVLYCHKHPVYGTSVKFIREKKVGPCKDTAELPDKLVRWGMLWRRKDQYDFKSIFEVEWVNEKYLKWSSAVNLIDSQGTLSNISGAIDPFKSKGKWKNPSTNTTPAIKVIFYAREKKVTGKAKLVSIAGKEGWFPLSRLTFLGDMPVTYSTCPLKLPIHNKAYETEEWLLIEKFGQEMSDNFKNAKLAIHNSIQTDKGV